MLRAFIVSRLYTTIIVAVIYSPHILLIDKFPLSMFERLLFLLSVS